MTANARAVNASRPAVVGLGGSLRRGSSSLAALRRALAGAEEAGAETELISVARLDLPFYAPDVEPPESALRLGDAVHSADALIWSSPLYQGSVSGSFKNAVDWLQVLAGREPPFLHDKVVGLVAAAGGTHGLQAVNTMDFMVRALRGWAVPLVAPVARSWRAFDSSGRMLDDSVDRQLRRLGAEVVRAARQVMHTGTCDYADHPSPLDDPLVAPLDAALQFGPLPGPGDSEGG